MLHRILTHAGSEVCSGQHVCEIGPAGRRIGAADFFDDLKEHHQICAMSSSFPGQVHIPQIHGAQSVHHRRRHRPDAVTFSGILLDYWRQRAGQRQKVWLRNVHIHPTSPVVSLFGLVSKFTGILPSVHDILRPSTGTRDPFTPRGHPAALGGLAPGAARIPA